MASIRLFQLHVLRVDIHLSGVGKTHLTIALGYLATQKGYKTSDVPRRVAMRRVRAARQSVSRAIL